MNDSRQTDTLCERCSLLSFDDLAIGGREVVGKYGTARLCFLESHIQFRPSDWLEDRELYKFPPFYRLVSLDWRLEDTLPDMPRLSRSSQLGCAFCRALLSSLEERFAEESKAHAINAGILNLAAYLSLADDGIEGLVVEVISDQTDFNSSFNATHIMFLVEAAPNCAEWLGVEPARNASYLDPMNVRRMRQLLDHCTSKCPPEDQSSFLPTRLIDVGNDASVTPRLVLSSKVSKSKQTKYATLSYCWGSEKDAESQFKTEKASLERRCVGLPSELMTATTNDAIALARKIGLRYLWVDALCIIQDDKDDWSRESSQMNLVYRHAFVAFCCLNSDSCHESFLSRAPAIEVHFQSTIRRAIKGFYLIRIRSKPESSTRPGNYTWDKTLSKWDKRCWTYQEQEMSNRLFMFGSLRMHFFCARCQWSEGDEAPTDRSRVGVIDQITRFKDQWISSKELYECWGWLVHGYGHRSVTFEKDRLPAIAGLARMIGEALQDQYLAGLWKGDLIYGLAWYSRGDILAHGLEAHLRNVRQRNYLAPSWSWAACPGVAVARYPGANIVEESTVVDVSTDTGPKDPYGQVFGGSLRMRAKMAGMPGWLPNDRANRWLNTWYRTVGDDDSIQVITDWLHKDDKAGLEILVLMLLHRIEHENETKEPSLRALLLHPTGETDQYYRVGVVVSTGHEGCRVMRGWFDDSQEETICII